MITKARGNILKTDLHNVEFRLGQGQVADRKLVSSQGLMTGSTGSW